MLSEKEKAVSLEISGDYFTEQEMRDMKIPEPLVVDSVMECIGVSGTWAVC